MNEEKRKRILRWGCLILAGVFTLSLLGSVVVMLLFHHDAGGDAPVRQHRFQREGKGEHVQ